MRVNRAWPLADNGEVRAVGESIGTWVSDSAMRMMRHRTGLTLIEALLAMTLLSVVVLALMQSLHAGHAQVNASMEAMRAHELAEGLVEEILTREYADPAGAPLTGGAGEADRSTFATIQDYHGLEEPAGTLVDPQGEAYDEPYQRFERSVHCAYVSMNPAGFSEPVPGIEVTVTVELPEQRAWELVRFIAEPELD